MDLPKTPDAADGVDTAWAMPPVGPVRCIHAAGAALGEGVLWSVREQALYWVDVLGRQLHRWHPGNGTRAQWAFDEEISAVAERSNAQGLLITLRRGFAFFDPTTGDAPRYVHQPVAEPPSNRFNDGKCDAHGRFWGGSMDFACQQPTGVLYRYDPDGRCTHHETGLVIINGPAWAGAAQGGHLYLNDTAQGCVYRYHFDAEHGHMSNRQLWLRMAEGDGAPDGITTDAQGRVWIAHWGGGCVSCHHPDTAQELGRVHLPTSQVTNCTFGGADLQTLFISTARADLSPQQLASQPLAGGLFAVDVACQGLPAHLFGG